MNILLINYEYPPVGGGSATAACHIAGSLVLMDHNVFVLTSSTTRIKGPAHERGIVVYRVPALRRRDWETSLLEMLTFNISAFAVLPRLIKKHRIQGVLAFFSFPCGPLGLWGKIACGVPYVVCLRGGDVPGAEPSLSSIHMLLTPLRRIVFQYSLSVVANSKGLKAMAQKADPACPISVIPNGVDTDQFRPKDRPAENLRFRFLFVGRFRHERNLFFLLSEMDVLYREYRPEVSLQLVGDGPLKRRLVQYAQSLSIRDRVSFHPWCSRSAIRPHYEYADCLVNPSLYEGMSNSVLEAMACGLPVIASRVGGNETLIKHRRNGLLFSLGHGKEFRNCLHFVSSDRTAAKQMGQNGRGIVEKEFSWKSVARAYLECFQVG